MSVSFKINDFLTRKIHDNYSILSTVARRLHRSESPPPDFLLEKWQIQKAGEHIFDNNFEAEVLGTNDISTRYSWGDAWAYRLRNVQLVGEVAHIFFQGGSLFNIDPVTQIIKKERTIRRPIRLLQRMQKGPLLHLCGPNSENHGHFILDHLPRLLPFLERFHSTPSAQILVSQGRKKWQARYLAHFGIPETRIIEANFGTIQVEELWYAPILHTKENHAKLSAPTNHLAVKNALAVKTKSVFNPLCIFASRQDAPNKRLLNEEHLAHKAKEVFDDVRIIKLSEHTLDEQLHLFASASVIIGAVGQNLTEVLCASGKLVLIMTVEEQINPNQRSWGRAYHNLALLGGNKSVLLTRDSATDTNRNWSFNEDRFVHVLRKSWHLFQQGSLT